MSSGPLGPVRGSHAAGPTASSVAAMCYRAPVDRTPRAAPPTLEHRPPQAGRPALEIHRSARRRRSAQAHARDGVVVVRLPAGLATDEEERLIARLVRRVTGAERADRLGGDAALERRARELADRYLDGIRPSSVRWSGRMGRRYGSCSPADGSIRISRDVAPLPAFVRDYVLLHELAHLVVADHSSAFHALVGRYPERDRARGYLEGYAAGRLAGGTPPAPGAPAAVASSEPDDLVD